MDFAGLGTDFADTAITAVAHGGDVPLFTLEGQAAVLSGASLSWKALIKRNRATDDGAGTEPAGGLKYRLQIAALEGCQDPAASVRALLQSIYDPDSLHKQPLVVRVDALVLGHAEGLNPGLVKRMSNMVLAADWSSVDPQTIVRIYGRLSLLEDVPQLAEFIMDKVSSLYQVESAWRPPAPELDMLAALPDNAKQHIIGANIPLAFARYPPQALKAAFDSFAPSTIKQAAQLLESRYYAGRSHGFKFLSTTFKDMNRLASTAQENKELADTLKTGDNVRIFFSDRELQGNKAAALLAVCSHLDCLFTIEQLHQMVPLHTVPSRDLQKLKGLVQKRPVSYSNAISPLWSALTAAVQAREEAELDSDTGSPLRRRQRV